jgi:hypothetical protein
MAADFGIGPVPQGVEAHEIVEPLASIGVMFVDAVCIAPVCIPVLILVRR